MPTEDDEQDLCLPTTGALTTYDAPELFLFRVTQPLVDADDPVYLVQADIRAVADGSDSELVNVHVTGFLDFTEAPDFDLCDVVDAFGLSCVPCPDQPSNQCLPIDLYGIRAPADTQFSPADVDASNAFECDGVG